SYALPQMPSEVDPGCWPRLGTIRFPSVVPLREVSSALAGESGSWDSPISRCETPLERRTSAIEVALQRNLRGPVSRSRSRCLQDAQGFGPNRPHRVCNRNEDKRDHRSRVVDCNCVWPVRNEDLRTKRDKLG